MLGSHSPTLAATAHRWGAHFHRCQAARSTSSKGGPPAPAPSPQVPSHPLPMPALPVQGHQSAVLQGQEHDRGWGLYGRYPKIEVELQRGIDGGCWTCAVWSREMGSETGTRRGVPLGGLALIALQVESGTLGLRQHIGCQADPCLVKAPLGMGKDLGGIMEPLLGQAWC